MSKFIAKLLQQKDTLLELGCHDGVSSNFFSLFCKNVDAIDTNEKTIAEACSNFGHINFMHRDALEYVPDKKYDVIVMLDFIEHFNENQGKLLIEKYARFISPAGMVIIGTPNRNFIKLRAKHNKEHHLHEYYPEELQNLLEHNFSRVMLFSMNDELVHTGNIELAWFIFAIALCPKIQYR